MIPRSSLLRPAPGIRQRSWAAITARRASFQWRRATPGTAAGRRGIRAKSALKRVNSGSLKHFQRQPSLCHKRLHWMQAKPKKNRSPGLTAPKWLCFSRSHVASQHATANPHRSRRHRRRLAAFDSCARTYYPTYRCGTSQRVSNRHTGTLQKPAPAPVRVFSFQDLVSDATTMHAANRTTRTRSTTMPRGGCACAMRGTTSTAFP